MIKGYLRDTRDTKKLYHNIQRLRRAGVPLSEIVVGGNIIQLIDSLKSGDCLVVPSVAELSPQNARQQQLLGRITNQGITIQPLDKVGAAPKNEEYSLLERLMCRLRLRKQMPEDSEVEIQMGDERARIIACLKPYYQFKEPVKTICAKAEITPWALSEFLKENNLPTRRNIKSNPKINPLRKPGFLDSLLEAYPTDDNAASH